MTCVKDNDICEWKDDKCVFKSEAAKEKKTRCAGRKEPKCLEESKCSWDGQKCSDKTVDLERRHCMYTSKRAIKPKAILDIKKSKKEAYDPGFRSLTNIHMGQRKLLLSEIQLLTEYYKTYKVHPTVLYIGAAPGTHLLFLSELFPHVTFVLYDGARFDPRVKQYQKVFKVHEGKDGFFTTDVCNEIKDKYNNLVFVCDIRLGSNNANKFQEGVARDMELQKQWVKILQPKISLLKFRLPYTMKHGDKLKYIKGDIMYQVWPKPQSGETRLMVTQENINKSKTYDFQDYEESIFYHNKYLRSLCYKNDFQTYVDYCPCYDCNAELTIIEDYVKHCKPIYIRGMDQIVEMFVRFMGPIKYNKKQDMVSL
jgi:hypothetical protein